MAVLVLLLFYDFIYYSLSVLMQCLFYYIFEFLLDIKFFHFGNVSSYMHSLIQTYFFSQRKLESVHTVYYMYYLMKKKKIFFSNQVIYNATKLRFMLTLIIDLFCMVFATKFSLSLE